MNSFNLDELSKVNKILKHVNPNRLGLDYNTVDKDELVEIIIDNAIKYVQALAQHPNFVQIQDKIFSYVMRAGNMSELEINLNPTPTYFGYVKESMHWKFSVANKTSDKKKFDIEVLSKKMQQYQEEEVDDDIVQPIRMEKILFQKDIVLNIYEQILKKSPFLSKRQAVALASVIIFDLEYMSANFKKVFFVCLENVSEDNKFDTWTSCLDITIDYEKSNFLNTTSTLQ